MTTSPLEVQYGGSTPTVRQLSVFLENRVGALLRLTQIFDATDIRILAVSVIEAVDCAVCRLLVDDADKAYKVLSDNEFASSQAELLIVSLPHGRRALLHTLAALLGGEVNIRYTYPLLIRPRGAAALAVCTDDIDQAARVLRERKYVLLDEEDLLAEREH